MLRTLRCRRSHGAQATGVRVEVAVTARSTGVDHVGPCVRDRGAACSRSCDATPIARLRMPTQGDGP